ncbi:hypothetical protein J2T18_003763 [Paenibacillus polymyxa]|nr:hypothetical protein [Paenibacillus polymyxa]
MNLCLAIIERTDLFRGLAALVFLSVHSRHHICSSLDHKLKWNAASFFAAGLIVRNIAFPPVVKEKISREASVSLQVVIAFKLLVPMLNGIG